MPRPRAKIAPRAASYARYPRYPQAESPWRRLGFRDSFRMWPRRSSGNGGKPSQPQPRRMPGLVFGRRPAEADGRAADEAAAMRTRTGLPFSGCDGGRLRTAPIRNLKRPSGTDRNRHRTKGLRAGGTDRRDTGSSDPGPARQKAMSSGKRAATGSEGTSVPEGSGRTGFRPGSCEPGMDPGLRLMAMSRRNQGFGRGSCRTRFLALRSLKTQRPGRGTRVPNPPSGEPPGLRPCRGATRGTLTRLRPRTDSGGCGARTCPGYRASKPPIAKGLLRRNRTRRDSGGRQQCRPPLLFVCAATVIQRRSCARPKGREPQ